MKIDINKTYRTKSGYPVRILCVDRNNPIAKVIALMNRDGEEIVMYYNLQGQDVLDSIGTKQTNLVEFYGDFVLDEKVLVRDDSDREWVPGHFAGVDHSTGKAMTFSGGKTSWTACSENRTDVLVWKFCKKPAVSEALADQVECGGDLQGQTE